MKNKSKIVLANCLFLFTASLFIKAGCSKSNEDVDADPPLPTADQFVTWNYSNVHGSLQSPADSLFGYVNSGSTSVHGGTSYTATSQVYLSTAFAGITSGTFKMTDLNIMTGGHYFVSASAPAQVTVTTYGGAGQYIVGSYSGTVKDSTGSGQTSIAYPVHGNFKVRRLN